MIGSIAIYSKIAVPSKYLLCDGASYLRADYADLFAVIGTTFGAADGTHFNVPSLVGKSIFGKDGTTEFSDLNTSGGAKTTSLTHAHTPNTHQHAYGSGSPTGGASSVGTDRGGAGATIGPHTHPISTINCGNQSAASMTTHTNNTQDIKNKYFTAYFLIKALN